MDSGITRYIGETRLMGTARTGYAGGQEPRTQRHKTDWSTLTVFIVRGYLRVVTGHQLLYHSLPTTERKLVEMLQQGENSLKCCKTEKTR